MTGKIQNHMPYMMVIQLVDYLFTTAGRFENPGFSKPSEVMAGQGLRHTR